MAEHGQRGGQPGLPRGCEGCAHSEAISEIVYRIAQGDQIGQQPQFCGHVKSESWRPGSAHAPKGKPQNLQPSLPWGSPVFSRWDSGNNSSGLSSVTCRGARMNPASNRAELKRGSTLGRIHHLPNLSGSCRGAVWTARDCWVSAASTLHGCGPHG